MATTVVSHTPSRGLTLRQIIRIAAKGYEGSVGSWDQFINDNGIKFPVAMTIAAFAKTVSELDTPLPPCQDISGRLWDVLTMFRLAAKRGGSEIRFPVTVINWVCVDGKRVNRTKRETVILKALCGPGDNGEPVITIMLPDED